MCPVALVDGIYKVLVVEGKEDPERVRRGLERMERMRRDDRDAVFRDIAGERHFAGLADADVLELDPSLLAWIPVLHVNREAHPRDMHARVAEGKQGVDRELEVAPLVAAPDDLLGAEKTVRGAVAQLEERRDAN